MSQHLGSIKNQNALRTHLQNRNVSPEECDQFDLVAHGPIRPEVTKPSGFRYVDKDAVASLMALHRPVRNLVGWLPIRRAFAVDFPKLGTRV
jgi:hypothetical protein